MNKPIYLFSEGHADMVNLLGNKGANLAEMTHLGLPVPHGFTITTEVCAQYYANNQQLPDNLMPTIMDYVAQLEQLTGKQFGNPNTPLLLAIRSGASTSMPGMMDTVLNLGLNDQIVADFVAIHPNPQMEHFIYDTYRRFIQAFSTVVAHIDNQQFETTIDVIKSQNNITSDNKLTVSCLKELIQQFKDIYVSSMHEAFPSDPIEQLQRTIKAVFDSWNNPRAQFYRRTNHLSDMNGTAVTIMEMIYGNYNANSGTGVVFTRDPTTGEKHLTGEFLIHAQGEDLVAGTHTPLNISKIHQIFPAVYQELTSIGDILEKHYRNMQDIEFTIENGKLFILQTRNGKRSTKAALRIPCDMVDEQIIDIPTALSMVASIDLQSLSTTQLAPSALHSTTPIGNGLNASHGAATGQITFTIDDAIALHAKGTPVILVRPQTDIEDLPGMQAANGILTAKGGITSHAAVLARNMNKPCITGCKTLHIAPDYQSCSINGTILNVHDYISVDGSTGTIYKGKMPIIAANTSPYLQKILHWQHSTLDNQTSK